MSVRHEQAVLGLAMLYPSRLHPLNPFEWFRGVTRWSDAPRFFFWNLKQNKLKLKVLEQALQLAKHTESSTSTQRVDTGLTGLGITVSVVYVGYTTNMNYTEIDLAITDDYIHVWYRCSGELDRRICEKFN